MIILLHPPFSHFIPLALFLVHVTTPSLTSEFFSLFLFFAHFVHLSPKNSNFSESERFIYIIGTED